MAPAARLSTPTYAAFRLAPTSVTNVTVGMPASASRSTAAATSGVSGALRITPSDPCWAMSSSSGDRRRGVAVLAQVGPCAQHRRAQRPQLGLEGVAGGAGEPVGRLHHQVEDPCAGGQLDLSALALELGDGLVDLGHRLRTDSLATVQHPVDRGAAQPGLARDVDHAMLASCPHPLLPPDPIAPFHR